MQTRPPRTAERLIALALGRDHERDMVLGDLHEEYVSVRPANRRDAWYWRQALSVAVHALVRRDRSGAAPYRSGDFFMRIFLKDVKYAWRSLLKRPLLTVTVATTLAFGLGANAAIFNLIDRMVLRPFPLADPDHTVLLSETGPRLDYGNKETVSPANFLDWRTSAGTITHLSGDPVVGRQPRRARQSGAAAGVSGLVWVLRCARHAAGARPRLRARRRDLRPSSRGRPQRRALEAAFRRATRRSSDAASRSTASPTR